MVVFRSIVFWLHLACGVVAGLVVFTMSITGVALTYEKQILHSADGFRAAPPTPDASRLGVRALLEEARSRKGEDPTGLRLLSEPYEPARVYFGRSSTLVDPYTGEPFGEGAVGTRRFFRQMIVWHRWLGQDGDGRDVGKAVTGACNLAFLFLILSGSYLWWPKEWTWKRLRQIVWFRGGLSPKARDFNWHNAIGFWCAVPLALVVVTATFFSYSWPGKWLYVLTGEEAPQRNASSASAPKGEEEPNFGDLDRLWAAAEADAAPDWQSITLRLPDDPDSPVRFEVDRSTGFRPDLKSTLVIDRSSGQVLRRETVADEPVARQARLWIRWVHTGEAGGIAGQTLAGIASAGACVLVYSGLMLSWRRFRAWRSRGA